MLPSFSLPGCFNYNLRMYAITGKKKVNLPPNPPPQEKIPTRILGLLPKKY